MCELALRHSCSSICHALIIAPFEKQTESKSGMFDETVRLNDIKTPYVEEAVLYWKQKRLRIKKSMN